MLRFKLAMVVAVGLLFAQSAVADLVVNGSFENPVIPWEGGGNYITTASTPNLASFGNWGWTFSNTVDTAQCGVLSSAGTAGNGLYTVDGEGVEHRNGLDGYQCVSFQNHGDGWISQNVSGFVDGTATVSFYGSGYDGSAVVNVTLDGSPVLFNGNSTVTLGSTPGTLTKFSTDIAVTAGSHILKLDAPNGMGNIDRVSVTQTPEPATLVLLVSGLIGLVCYAWRKRK